MKMPADSQKIELKMTSLTLACLVSLALNCSALSGLPGSAQQPAKANKQTSQAKAATKSPAYTEEQIRSFIEIGYSYYDKKDYGTAARYLLPAGQIKLNDGNLQDILGTCFMHLERYREAWQYFERAHRLEPNDGELTLRLAYVYHKCQDDYHAGLLLDEIRQRFKDKPELLSHASDLAASLKSPKSDNQKKDESATDGYLARAQAARRDIAKGQYNAYDELTYCLYKARRFDELEPALLEAVGRFPKEKHYYTNLMRCQIDRGNLEGLQATRRLFIERFPNDPDSKRVKDELAYYERDFKNARARERSGQATEDFNQGYEVFSRGQMPLKVFVPSIWKSKIVWTADSTGKAQVKKTGIDHTKLVERAFSEWSEASQRAITFTFIGTGDNADIECQWTDDKAKLQHSFAAGETHSEVGAKGQRKEIVYILVSPKSDRQSPSEQEEEFYTTALHEIGHALGLSHSTNPQDIMYFSSSSSTPSNCLAPGDISRIRNLYRKP